MASGDTPKAPLNFLNGWPVDDEGQPMVLITMGVSEKIGMPHYSNVDLGPASVSKFVKDDKVEIDVGMREILKTCEEVIGEEREAVIELVKQSIQSAHRPGT